MQGVLLNVIATIYTFPYGLSGAASTRVANALGAGDHRAAVNTAAVSLIVVVSCPTPSAHTLCQCSPQASNSRADGNVRGQFHGSPEASLCVRPCHSESICANQGLWTCR